MNESTFYPAFIKDLKQCREELIIECPFITTRHTLRLLPDLQSLLQRGVRITINTRGPQEHEQSMRREAEDVIECFKEMGIQVLFTGGHHRKLVVMDREIMYEGSLNVLSQGDSCEVMRRIGSKVLATEMLRFVKLQPFLRS